MGIEVSRDYYEEHIKPVMLNEDKALVESLSYGSSMSTDVEMRDHYLTEQNLDTLYDIAKSTNNKSFQSKLSSYRSILKNPDTAKISNLAALPAALKKYFAERFVDGWIYKQIRGSNELLPYLVVGIAHHEPSRKDERASVEISIIANSSKEKGVSRSTISIDSDDTNKRTIPEMLLAIGVYPESEELKQQYDEDLKLFQEYQPMHNKQFVGAGKAVTVGERYSYNDREYSINGARMVNDDALIQRRYTPTSNNYLWHVYSVGQEYSSIPYHCHIYMFDLSTHQNAWVHSTQIVPYVYDGTVRDKLVLPQEHRDLIDVLVEDLDILQEDIIKGKSGGTTILCSGTPGLGKTLSAEVYSEIMKKPLYRVHSGQLGISPDDVERNLEHILKRADRWKAILLIDEADVYIRSRGDNMGQNAVVAAFLRTLEYFSGILFMTTNRYEHVDDAILSRCIAVIQYKTPDTESARKIWRVLADQFQIDMSKALIEELVQEYPDLSGRDIKELLKLSSRFAIAKKEVLGMDTFRKCAQFRGVAK